MMQMNEDLAFLFGAYIGRLGISKDKRIKFHSNDLDAVQKIAKAIQRITKKEVKIRPGGNKSTYSIYFNNVELTNALQRETKIGRMVPLKRLDSHNLQKSFIDGLFTSAAYAVTTKSNTPQVFCKTKHRECTPQTLLVLAELGVFAGIQPNDPEKISITQFDDLEILRKLRVLPVRQQETLERLLESVPKKASYGLRMFEEFLILRGNGWGAQRIANKLGVDKQIVTTWQRGVIPHSVKKLPQLYRLSKRFDFKLSFMHHYSRTLDHFLEEKPTRPLVRRNPRKRIKKAFKPR